MGTLIEKAEWTEGVRYLEEGALVTGGPDAKDNEPIQDLTNRTVWLKDKTATVQTALTEQIEVVETGLTEHTEAEDPHPQYVTSPEMEARIGRIEFQGQINSDWNATEGAAEILNKPELSEVALSGLYDDLAGKPENLATVNDIALLSTQKFDKSGGTVSGRISLKDANVWIDRDEYGQIVMSSSGSTFALSMDGGLFTNGKLLRCVTDAFNDGTNWYRKWSDGWIEQGGAIGSLPEGEITITFPLPFAQADYHFNASQVGAFDATSFYIRWIENYRKTPTSIAVWGGEKMWYACGQGA